MQEARSLIDHRAIVDEFTPVMSADESTAVLVRRSGTFEEIEPISRLVCEAMTKKLSTRFPDAEADVSAAFATSLSRIAAVKLGSGASKLCAVSLRCCQSTPIPAGVLNHITKFFDVRCDHT